MLVADIGMNPETNAKFLLDTKDDSSIEGMILLSEDYKDVYDGEYFL